MNILRIKEYLMGIWSHSEQLYKGLCIVVSLFTIILFWIGKSENIPTLWISAIAVALSYNSHLYTKEKFRLELLKERLEIYDNIAKYCSLLIQTGTLASDREETQVLISAARKSAENSFRGKGLHKARFLFGNDFRLLCDRLNSINSWFLAYSDRPHDMNDWPEQRANRLNETRQILDELFNIFSPYMYFGDFTNLNVRPH